MGLGYWTKHWMWLFVTGKAVCSAIQGCLMHCQCWCPVCLEVKKENNVLQSQLNKPFLEKLVSIWALLAIKKVSELDQSHLMVILCVQQCKKWMDVTMTTHGTGTHWFHASKICPQCFCCSWCHFSSSTVDSNCRAMSITAWSLWETKPWKLWL